MEISKGIAECENKHKWEAALMPARKGDAAIEPAYCSICKEPAKGFLSMKAQVEEDEEEDEVEEAPPTPQESKITSTTMTTDGHLRLTLEPIKIEPIKIEPIKVVVNAHGLLWAAIALGLFIALSGLCFTCATWDGARRYSVQQQP